MATPWPLILLLRSLGAKGEPWMHPIWALSQGSHNLCDHTPSLGWPIVRQWATLAAAAASPAAGSEGYEILLLDPIGL